jgi:hypothetical protein
MVQQPTSDYALRANPTYKAGISGYHGTHIGSVIAARRFC